MDLSSLSTIFKFIIIILIYIIIYYALKIMYKDIKQGERRGKKSIGLEVIEIGRCYNLKVGAIIPVNSSLTIGRDDKNNLVLVDKFVSSNHAIIKLKNDRYYIEDLKSTNGTLLNDNRITQREWLKNKDMIQIGETVFKVI